MVLVPFNCMSPMALAQLGIRVSFFLKARVVSTLVDGYQWLSSVMAITNRDSKRDGH